jgi:pimeloyl-ACP methyl ester carboxylesterase
VTQMKRAIRKENSLSSRLATQAATLAAGTLAVAGGWILYSKLAIDHDVPLQDAIPAEREAFLSKTAGRLSYYVDRQVSGRPLVLIHSVNAAASAYEMRPLFEHYRSQRPVFALDLPGYGFSERSSRVYAPQVFESAILDLLTTQVGEPADVIALSLGCEFVARAALAQPERFHSLALISPSGFNPPDAGRASQRAGVMGASDVLYSLFSFPLWSRAFFDLIATRRSIEFFLGQSFVGPIAPGFVDYAYATSHQAGAERVPLYFLSGKLFTPNVLARVYQNVHTPTLVIYDQDAFVRFDRLPDLLESNPHWQAERITPSLGLPHFEKLPETVQVLNKFWQGLE